MEGDAMIALVARYRVKEGNFDTVIQALEEMAPLVAELEPDCSHYAINRSREDPNVILLYECYSNMEASDFHRKTPHFKKIIEGRVAPLLDSREREFFDVVIE